MFLYSLVPQPLIVFACTPSFLHDRMTWNQNNLWLQLAGSHH